MTTSDNIYFGCNPPENSASAILDRIEKKAKWLKWIGILGNTGNLSWTAYTWFNDNAIVDKCYTISGNSVQECNTTIFGEWVINVSPLNCSDGNTTNYSDIITLNENGTATSFGSFQYITNNFTFSNNTLNIAISYNDGSCGGTSIIVNRNYSFIYDPNSDSFTGSFTESNNGATDEDEENGGGCSVPALTCSGSGTMNRN